PRPGRDKRRQDAHLTAPPRTHQTLRQAAQAVREDDPGPRVPRLPRPRDGRLTGFGHSWPQTVRAETAAGGMGHPGEVAQAMRDHRAPGGGRGTLPQAAGAVEWLADLVADGDVVVLSGAGVSTESGIPDYRGETGRLRRARPMTYQTFVGSVEARRRYWARSHLGWRHI